MMMSSGARQRQSGDEPPYPGAADEVFRPRDIEAHLWATPNSRRVSILLEELGLSYTVRPVNIRAGEQFAPAILRLNPYGKVPIVTWRDGEGEHVLAESGAILLSFAERAGRLLPYAGEERRQVLQWLMVSLTALGPLSGQAHHWTELAPDYNASAIDHHAALVDRVYRLLDGRLASRPFLAGDQYSIADIATYPWVERCGWTGLDRRAFGHVSRWFEDVGARPAVAAGMAQPEGVVLEPVAPRLSGNLEEGVLPP